MSKKPSDKLYNLIKSLSGSEKRYFKVFVKPHSVGADNKYMELFEVIEKQSEFNDEELMRHIYPDLDNPKSKRYPELKSYLYELILKALQNYDESQNYNIKIKRLINNIEVLFDRFQVKEAKHQMQKAQKFAESREDFSSLLILWDWSKKIALAQKNIVKLGEAIQVINEEVLKVKVKQENLATYRDLFYLIMFYINNDPLRRDEQMPQVLKDVKDHPLMQDDQQALSHRAKCLFHRIHSLHAYTTLEHKKFHYHSKILIELFDQNTTLIREETSEYIAALSNYALSCGLLEKYDEVALTIPKYLEIKAVKEVDKIKIHWQYYGLSLALSIYTGEFVKGKELLEDHLRKVKKFPKGHFEAGSLYHYYFYIYFGAGEYDLALKYLNEWLNLPRSSKRQDLQSIARILNLIIHFEMENFALLDFLLRSSYRYLKKRNRLYQIEKDMIGLIRDASKLATADMKKPFLEMKETFESLKQEPNQKVIFQYFDFTAWLDSRINKMPFAQVVRERHLAKKK